MKILVFSDSHGVTHNMNYVTKRIINKIDCIIHLGDCTNDIDTIMSEYPGIDIKNVSGNCDHSNEIPSELVFKAGGAKLLITHGHKHNVKWGLDRLSYLAEEREVQAVLFGHTHVPVIEYYNGILVFNPGSISMPRTGGPPTYGIIDIDRGIIRPAILELHSDGTIRGQYSGYYL